MAYTVAPMTSVERAVMALLVSKLPALGSSDARVGGDFGFYPATMDFYIRIDRVPGGRTDRHEGDTVVDIEVFSQDYALAESASFAIEALMLGYPHTVMVGDQKVVFDDVFQNSGVADLPWDDDSTYRLGATYVITARRR